MTSIKPIGSSPIDLPTAPHPSHGLGSSAPGGASSAPRPDVAAVDGALSGSSDPMAALARGLDAGSISLEQALAVLVERAVGGVDTQLGATERTELLGVLRAALADDPTLASLRDASR